MPRAAEIDHYSWLIAGLTIAAARAGSAERLAEVNLALFEAHQEFFTLLAHDASALRPDLDADLMASLRRDRVTA